MAETYTLTVGHLRDLILTLKATEPPIDVYRWLLPAEWVWYEKLNFIRRLPDGRTVTTRECSAAGREPAGIEVRSLGFLPSR